MSKLSSFLFNFSYYNRINILIFNKHCQNMGVKFFLLISAVLFSLGIGLLSSYLLFTVEPPALAEEEIKALAKEYFSSSDASAEDGYVDQPMTGKVVIVTGATSGLGASFAFSMYKVKLTHDFFLLSILSSH